MGYVIDKERLVKKTRFYLPRKLSNINVSNIVLKRSKFLLKWQNTWLKLQGCKCDLIRLLQRCGRDTHNTKYICPIDLQAAHNHRLNKLSAMEERKRHEEQMRKAKEHEAEFYAQKSRFFGIVIQDNDIEITVLNSLEAYKEEGETLHHCVFRCEYYAKQESIILSAHDHNGHRIETVELSLTDGKVIQSRAVCNTNSQYHDRIINLVNANAYRFMEAKATA